MRNYAFIKGHYKTLFTALPDGGYYITQYQFLPGHLNWIPYSGKKVSEEEAAAVMKRLAKQQYSLVKGV